ncbi:hypothetical protein ARMGADRAFT_783166 [Armillaria gallica]|uniref:Uncharacterized protein n=1 Tax=Armillaria gallica TaxID=47427 RepID=A0A2H3CDU9_ARMGA|nr:hypothetical protein ARMGADRAFT_783166 [Armillaria gallica]
MDLHGSRPVTTRPTLPIHLLVCQSRLSVDETTRYSGVNTRYITHLERTGHSYSTRMREGRCAEEGNTTTHAQRAPWRSTGNYKTCFPSPSLSAAHDSLTTRRLGIREHSMYRPSRDRARVHGRHRGEGGVCVERTVRRTWACMRREACPGRIV